MDAAKKEILDRLKAAQAKRGEIGLEQPDFTSAVYQPLDENLVEEFRKKIELVSGNLLLAKDIEEGVQHLKKLIQENKWEQVHCTDQLLQKYLTGYFVFTSDDAGFENMKVGITRCEALVAHLGAVLVSSAHQSGRRMNVFPEIHVIFAYEDQIVDFLENGLDKIQRKYGKDLPSLISVITGPSRTADIEKTLVMGMHGPKSLYVILSKKPF